MFELPLNIKVALIYIDISISADIGISEISETGQKCKANRYYIGISIGALISVKLFS